MGNFMQWITAPKKSSAGNQGTTLSPVTAPPAATGLTDMTKKKKTRTQSSFSSPLGIGGQADVARKTLLGG